ncbi:hypothetical protein [Novosphingobium panipatense]|uniref:hypothetical protein n=1 Tax=Novosphingobium panipatense TaxID=428991 RepID=UPI003607D1AF
MDRLIDIEADPPDLPPSIGKGLPLRERRWRVVTEPMLHQRSDPDIARKPAFCGGLVKQRKLLIGQPDFDATGPTHGAGSGRFCLPCVCCGSLDHLSEQDRTTALPRCHAVETPSQVGRKADPEKCHIIALMFYKPGCKPIPPSSI